MVVILLLRSPALDACRLISPSPPPGSETFSTLKHIRRKRSTFMLCSLVHNNIQRTSTLLLNWMLQELGSDVSEG